MDDSDPPPLSRAEIFAMVEQGRADAAAGRTVPVQTILDEIRETLARLERHCTGVNAV